MPNIKPTSCAANMRAMASPPVISSFSDMRVMLLVSAAPVQQGVDESFQRRANTAAPFAGACVRAGNHAFLVARAGIADARAVGRHGQRCDAALLQQRQPADAGAVF